jgi:Peptidase family M28
MIKRGILLTILALNILCSCDSLTLEKRLKNHVYYLASDDLNGRETGTKYDKMAAAYIQHEFTKIGLTPMGENGTFYQDYTFLANKTLGKNNHLSINGEELEIEKDYFPLNFSANSAIEGKIFNKGYGLYVKDTGFKFQNTNKSILNSIFLIEIVNYDSINSLREWQKYHDLRNLASTAEKQGAVGVIFYSCDSSFVDSKTNFEEKIPSVNIPVVFVTNCNWIKSEPIQIVSLKVENNEDRRTGRNVIGLIDNGAENTIIIAGHHDGIGNGENASPFGTEDNKLIYYGADDGASGVSVLVEFARWVKNCRLDQNNYLFISFSGEEMKLLGSIYFTNNPTIDLSNVTYMISLDHIGRMDPSEKEIILYGVGTSPTWKKLLSEIQIDGVSKIMLESGMGLTDYTSFYIKDIPVLGFNTQVHEDFHTPYDVAEKINYSGMATIFDVLTQIDTNLKYTGKLEFSTTSDIDPHEILKFIFRYIDYAFEGSLNKNFLKPTISETKP